MNPIPVIALILAVRIVIFFLGVGTFEQPDDPELSIFDLSVSEFLGIAVLGTIPGAPVNVNLIMGTIGILLDLLLIWAIVQLIRGV